MHLCSCQCSVVMVDRVLTHSLSNAWWGEVGILPPDGRQCSVHSLQSTLQGSSEAQLLSCYYGPGGRSKKLCLAGHKFSQSLFRETMLSQGFFKKSPLPLAFVVYGLPQYPAQDILEAKTNKQNIQNSLLSHSSSHKIPSQFFYPLSDSSDIYFIQDFQL